MGLDETLSNGLHDLLGKGEIENLHLFGSDTINRKYIRPILVMLDEH